MEQLFLKGDLVRWSDPLNNVALPAFYAIVNEIHFKKATLTFLGFGPHSKTQPAQRHETWNGGKNIKWDGPYSKEEIIKISKSVVQIGFGWEVKYLSKWDPTKVE
jgi:hypothetical protein